MRHCFRTVWPFEYGSAPYDAEREPQADELMTHAADFRITSGLVMPVAGPGGCIGDVWIGGPHLELADADKPVIHLLAVYAFERVQRINGSVPPQHAKLTDRQCEILKWIAAGKTAWEIGEILGIAGRTVEEHAEKAAHKLGAVNRTQAVATAIRDGLIRP